MNKKTFFVTMMITLTMGLTAVVAQPPAGKDGAKGKGKGPGADAMKLFTSSAEIQQLIAKSKEQRTKRQPTITQPVLSLAPYRASLEYRASVGPAAVHDTEAEMFYVIEGKATMTTGGTLVGDTTPNGPNHTGPSLEGGTERSVAAGDFIMVPEKTGHWFNKIDGVLVLMSIHLPK